MNCKKVNQLLIRYLEEDLNERDGSSVEKHLQECRQCEGEFLLLKQILESAKAKEIPSPSENYWANYTVRLWQKIGNRVPSFWKNWAKPLRWAIPAFALALLLIIILNSFRQQQIIPTPSPVAKAPSVQPGSTKIIKTEVSKSIPEESVRTTSVSRRYTLTRLANDIYELYNPSVNTTEVFDVVYAQAINIENALKEEKEKNDYLSLIDELTNEERKELMAKVKSLL